MPEGYTFWIHKTPIGGARAVSLARAAAKKFSEDDMRPMWNEKKDVFYANIREATKALKITIKESFIDDSHTLELLRMLRHPYGRKSYYRLGKLVISASHRRALRTALHGRHPFPGGGGIHSQSGKLREAIKSTDIPTTRQIRGIVYVDESETRNPESGKSYAKFVIAGTKKMVGRNFMIDSLWNPETRAMLKRIIMR